MHYTNLFHNSKFQWKIIIDWNDLRVTFCTTKAESHTHSSQKEAPICLITLHVHIITSVTHKIDIRHSVIVHWVSRGIAFQIFYGGFVLVWISKTVFRAMVGPPPYEWWIFRILVFGRIESKHFFRLLVRWVAGGRLFWPFGAKAESVCIVSWD